MLVVLLSSAFAGVLDVTVQRGDETHTVRFDDLASCERVSTRQSDADSKTRIDARVEVLEDGLLQIELLAELEATAEVEGRMAVSRFESAPTFAVTEGETAQVELVSDGLDTTIRATASDFGQAASCPGRVRLRRDVESKTVEDQSERRRRRGR